MTDQWAHKDEMHTIEPEDLAGLRTRLDEITGWPWMKSPSEAVITWSAQPVDRGPVMIAGRGVLPDGESDVVVVPDGIDAQFIADAPSIIDKLIDATDHWHSRFEHAKERALAAEAQLAAVTTEAVDTGAVDRAATIIAELRAERDANARAATQARAERDTEYRRAAAVVAERDALQTELTKIPNLRPMPQQGSDQFKYGYSCGFEDALRTAAAAMGGKQQ